MAYCNYCGTYVDEQAMICPNCNAALKYSQPDMPPAVDVNGNIPLDNHPKRGMAIASLVLGICSLLFTFFGLLLGILAVVFGSSANREGKVSVATAGKICGIIGIVCSVLFGIFITLLISLMIATGMEYMAFLPCL